MWNILCYPWWYVYTTYTDIEHNKSLPENRYPFGPILAGVQYTRCHQRLTWLPTSLLCVSYYICEYWNPSTICSRYKCCSLNWMHCFIEKWRNICISWHIYYITESHIIVFIKGYQFSSGLLSEYFLPEASFSLRVLWLPVSVCLCVCMYVCVSIMSLKFIGMITSHLFKPGSPNLDQKCKMLWLRFLLFFAGRQLTLILKVKFDFKKSKFPVSSLQEIRNHHITTREPWVPRLLHGSDCFMVFILYTSLYT